MASDTQPARDIKNHLLFEIATEVAHRGTSPTLGASSRFCSTRPLTIGLDVLQSVVSTP